MDHEINRRIKEFETKIIVLQFLTLLISIGLSSVLNYVIKEQLANTVGSFISRTASKGDLRETILNLEETRLNHFKEISLLLRGKLVSTVPNPIFFEKPNPIIQNLLYQRIDIPLRFENGGAIATDDNQIGEVRFVFNRLDLAPYALLLWFVSALLTVVVYQRSKKRTFGKIKAQLQQEAESRRGTLAKDVIHDLRTPLNSLQSLAYVLKSISKSETNLLISSIENVKGIITRLDMANPNSRSQKSYFLAQEVLKNIFEAQVRAVPNRISIFYKPSVECSNLFLHINLSQFQSLIQNIVENSIHAIKDQGEISISALPLSDSIEIKISDSGCGIAPTNLSHVFEKGWTYGKPNGSGTGLYNAKEFINKYGGEIKIESHLGIGTRVTLIIPKAIPPKWWVQSIEIPKNKKIILVDDQESQGHLWQLRLENLGYDVLNKYFYFQSAEKFDVFWRGLTLPEQHQYCLFFDYDLGKNEKSGIDLIYERNLFEQSLLVTGHYDDAELMARCEAFNLPILAKSLVSTVPMVFS